MKYIYPAACVLALALGLWIAHAAEQHQKQTDYFQRIAETK